jgi:D-lactate dehydrogenase
MRNQKVAVFSTKNYDRQFLEAANLSGVGRASAVAEASQPLPQQQQHCHLELIFFETQLNPRTALLAKGMTTVCLFVNDEANAETLKILAENGTQLLALRSAGYNHVDLKTAAELGIVVVRVPAYSPYSIAEHAVALILMLNRKLYRAYNRVRDDNFCLEGLLGFDIHGCTVGTIGTGKIGTIFAQIMQGFGCSVLGYDPYPNPDFAAIDSARSVDLPELLATADIISLHCPLTAANHHLIDAKAIAQMKSGVMLINTSRGGLIDTKAAIAGLKSGKIGYLGLDVYEQEADLFFEDLSDTVIQDDDFQLLQSFPNVVVTAHQAFFTKNALQSIAETTLTNIIEFIGGALPLALRNENRGVTLTNQIVFRN